ncbi:30S ribosomal protein S2 [Candidatus Dependentiae bacterium]|nr:30S ribosomal protein S2 [Candidatus Dependentiae bacterium]
MIDLRLLIKSGVHFGHQKSKRNPKMDPYIWGYKNNIHLIDVSKTAFQMEKAAKFLESIVSEGKSILWVGTKKAAQEIIRTTAQELNLPYVVNRWVGGTCTNYRQIRKAVANMLHDKDVIAKADELSHYTKKELSTIQKRSDRLEKNVGGIVNLAWPIGALVVIDVKKEHVCIKEALSMGIPVVALVDTNSDPSDIDFVIPANDDAPRSIEVVVNYLAESVKRGQESVATKPQETNALEGFENVLDSVLTLEEDEEESEANKKRRSSAGQAVKTAPKRPVAAKPRMSTSKRSDAQEPQEVKAKESESSAEGTNE